MTQELQFLATLAIVFIVLVFYLSLKHNQKLDEQKQKSKDKQSTEPSKKQIKKSGDIIDALDWMLAHGIIDTKEYTKLIGKCLPFLQ